MAKNPPWNANPEWAQHSLTMDEAVKLEDEGWMNSDDVKWPGGSPTNYVLMNEHSNGTVNDITMYDPSFGQEGGRAEIFGSQPSQWVEQDDFMYTIIPPGEGPGHRSEAAHLDKVLSMIGRTYGQTGK